MNVTQIIDTYAKLGDNSRMLISIGIGLLIYIGLRLLIRSFNKEAKRLQEQQANKKQRGSYWERLETKAKTELS